MIYIPIKDRILEYICVKLDGTFPCLELIRLFKLVDDIFILRLFIEIEQKHVLKAIF